MSYKDIANNIKSPRGYRAVANANARNPIPIIIPCHRVIKSNGDFGEYGGGSISKKEIIRIWKRYFLVNLTKTFAELRNEMSAH